MLKKLLMRLLLGCFAILIVTVAAVGCCFWMAVQYPASYRELRDEKITQVEIELIEKRLERETVELERWSALARQTMKRANNAGDSEAQILASEQRSLMLTQREINAILSGKKYTSGDLKNLRVVLLNDRVRLAVELETPAESSVVLSGDFRLTKISPNQLKLEILAGRIGNLPLPCGWLLGSIPDSCLPADGECEFHFSDSVPHITFEIAASNSALQLKQIYTYDNKLRLDFMPPPRVN